MSMVRKNIDKEPGTVKKERVRLPVRIRFAVGINEFMD
jgi:hypothetical protein